VILDGGGGVVCVEKSEGYIHGLFDYRIDVDLHCGRTMVRKISIVLCMPAKISGGGRKFQSFRGGWN